MKTIKLNNEQFTSEHIDQIQGLFALLQERGYNPKMVGVPTMTEAIITHDDDNGERMSKILFVRNGKLVAGEL